jgi:FkbM family methyltransferase
MPTASAEVWRKLRKLARLVVRRDYRTALRLGVAAAVEHGKVAFEREPRTVLDVGANRGQFALFALRRFPDAVVHCFEPVPAALSTLHRVLEGHEDVHVHAVALGGDAGEAQLHVSARDDSSSLLAVGSRLQLAYPDTRPVEHISVPVARLDSLLEPADLARPCLMKIDVQGFEAEVLRGASGLLPVVDDILVECSFVELYDGQPLADDLVSWLLVEGYRLRGVFSLTTDDSGACLQADLLFSRPDPTSARPPLRPAHPGETPTRDRDETNSASHRS